MGENQNPTKLCMSKMKGKMPFVKICKEFVKLKKTLDNKKMVFITISRPLVKYLNYFHFFIRF
jgi:hypothetical protein